MRKLRYILTAACALVAASSCQLRPLEEGEESIELKVVIELKTVLNVTTGIYNDKIPVPELKSDMFRVLFYNPETGKLVNQAFLSEQTTTSEGKEALGGSVSILPGTYDMICYNFDMPDTFVEGIEEISTLRAYTNEIPEPLRAQFEGVDDDTIYYEPDHVLVARDMGLKIAPHTGLLVIETEAATIVDTYYLQVRVEGLQYASSATAVLSGMAPSSHFGMAQRDDDNPCSVYFELQKSTDSKIQETNQDVLCNLFNTFGKVYPAESKSGTKAGTDSELKLNVVRTDGTTYDFDFDMNDIFLTEDALERHWLLIDTIIEIPQPDPGPSGGGGGFNPEVEDWEDEEGEIVI